MRSNISPATFITPSCICKKETPFCVFILDAAALLRVLCNFMPTASPPASSLGDTIRLPLDRRCKLFVRRLFARFIFNAECDAATFEFIVILTILSSLTFNLGQHPCRLFRIWGKGFDSLIVDLLVFDVLDNRQLPVEL